MTLYQYAQIAISVFFVLTGGAVSCTIAVMSLRGLAAWRAIRAELRLIDNASREQSE